MGFGWFGRDLLGLCSVAEKNAERKEKKRKEGKEEKEEKSSNYFEL